MSTRTRVLVYLGRVFSDSNGTPSSRRILFGVTVAHVLGLALGAICVQRKLTPEVVDLLKTALWVTGGTVGVGKIFEEKRPDQGSNP